MLHAISYLSFSSAAEGSPTNKERERERGQEGRQKEREEEKPRQKENEWLRNFDGKRDTLLRATAFSRALTTSILIAYKTLYKSRVLCFAKIAGCARKTLAFMLINAVLTYGTCQWCLGGRRAPSSRPNARANRTGKSGKMSSQARHVWHVTIGARENTGGNARCVYTSTWHKLSRGARRRVTNIGAARPPLIALVSDLSRMERTMPT